MAGSGMSGLLEVLKADARSEDVDVGRRLTKYLGKLGLKRPAHSRRVVHAFKRAAHDTKLSRRRELFKGMRVDPSIADAIREQGFVTLPPGMLKGTDALVDRLHGLWRERCGGEKVHVDLDWAGGTHKPFLRNCFLQSDFMDYPDISDWILQDDLIAVASCNFGHVPTLAGAQLWWSPVNETEIASQLFHFDPEDSRMLRVFVNVSDVTEESGPLTFVPAEQSRRLVEKYRRKFYRLSDEQVYAVVDRKHVKKLVGPAGSVHLIDPARCAHFGSRRCSADRLVLMLHFNPVPVHLEPSGWIPRIDEGRYESRETARLALPLRYKKPQLKSANKHKRS